MRKLLALLFIVALVSIAGYTSYWFYVSNQMKKHIVETMDNLKAEVGKRENNSFSYKEVKSYGYPNKFSFEIVEPSFSIKTAPKAETAENLEPELAEFAMSTDSVVITSNFKGDEVKIMTGKKLSSVMNLTKEIPEEGKKNVNIVMEGAKSTVFTVNFVDSFAKLKSPANAKEMIDQIKSIKYESAPFTLTDQTTQEVLVSIENDNTVVTFENTAGKFFFSIEGMLSGVSNGLGQGVDSFKLGKFNAETSIKAKFEGAANAQKFIPDFELNIQKYDVSTELYSLSIVGTITSNDQAIFPVGDVKIFLKDFSPLTQAFVEKNIISQKELEAALRILNKLADVADETNQKELLITVTSDGMGGFKIGNSTFEDVLASIQVENDRLIKEKAIAEGATIDENGNIVPAPVTETPANSEGGAAPVAPVAPSLAPAAPATPVPAEVPATAAPVAPTPAVPAAPSVPPALPKAATK